MHQKNSNHVGYHHIEGFQDCFIYKEDGYAKTIDTSNESPCKSWSSLLRQNMCSSGAAPPVSHDLRLIMSTSRVFVCSAHLRGAQCKVSVTEENNSPGTLVTKQEFRYIMYETGRGGGGYEVRVFSAGDLYGRMRHVAPTCEQHEGGRRGEREGGKEGGSHRFSHDFMTAEWSRTTEKGGLAAL